MLLELWPTPAADTSNKVKQTLAELNARHERDMVNLQAKHRTLNLIGREAHERHRQVKEERRAEARATGQAAASVDGSTRRRLARWKSGG